MHETIISAIITSITSIITATITSLLTLKLSNKKNDDKLNSLSDKRLFKSRQLSDFYIPFYRLYVQNVFPESDVTKMLPETATTFLKLFEKHVDLMEHGSQELVKPFQIAYYGWKSTTMIAHFLLILENHSYYLRINFLKNTPSFVLN